MGEHKYLAEAEDSRERKRQKDRERKIATDIETKKKKLMIQNFH